MPPAGSSPLQPVVLVWGDDEYSVKQRARQVFQAWCAEGGGFDHEIIDAAMGNVSEAMSALAKLKEALQTLPFFGGSKVIWFQNCSFLGDERTASTQAVTAALAELASELKRFPWENVRLLISAGKVDKRKSLYKTLEKIATVEAYAGWSSDDRNWSVEAEKAVRAQIAALKKRMTPEAVAQLVAFVGPQIRQLHNEIEKLAVFAGERPEITIADVEAVSVRNKQSQAFALGEALGARHLPRLIKALDEELWAMRTDRQKSEIGLLYGLISKVRTMILLKEMLRAGWIKAESDYSRFKAQLERLPAAALPEDRRFNPLAMNPYVLFKAMDHARKYSQAELVQAMERLLECNQRMVFSGLDEALVLQQALVRIVAGAGGKG